MTTDGAAGRSRYTLEMTVASALHIGTGRGDGFVDDTVVRDVAGRPIVPGTTLAGHLRALGERIAPDLESKLWGSEDAASPVNVDDAVIDLGGRGMGTRAGIRIDRDTGAVATGALYEHAVVPAGSRLTLVLETDDVALHDHVLALLGAVRRDGLRIGRATSRGMGRLVATGDPCVSRLDLACPSDLVSAARGNPPTATPIMVEAPSTGMTHVEVAWTSPVPVLSRDPRPVGEVDTLPLLVEAVEAGDVAGYRIALPGSSIKGALRAHAERIVRTVDPSRDDDRLPFIDRLFGSAKADGTGRRGAVVVDDCLSVGRIEPSELEALDPRAADQRVAIRDAEGAAVGTVLVAHHNAIDRWTGGAADGRLFDVAEARGVSWQPIRLTIDAEALGRSVPGDAEAPEGTTDVGLAAQGLLLLVLEDLAMGRVPLGGLVTRGRGSVVVEGMSWRDASGGSSVWVRSEDADRSASDGWGDAAAGPVAAARDAWRSAWRGATSGEEVAT